MESLKKGSQPIRKLSKSNEKISLGSFKIKSQFSEFSTRGGYLKNNQIFTIMYWNVFAKDWLPHFHIKTEILALSQVIWLKMTLDIKKALTINWHHCMQCCDLLKTFFQEQRRKCRRAQKFYCCSATMSK